MMNREQAMCGNFPHFSKFPHFGGKRILALISYFLNDLGDNLNMALLLRFQAAKSRQSG
jgi:hypothetical protein